MKEVLLVVRAKNNRLVQYRNQHGLSQTEMAGLCGLSGKDYGVIENLKKYPISRGCWSESASKIASVIGEPEEVLFPKAFEKIRTTSTHIEIGLSELPRSVQPALLISPDDLIDQDALKKTIENNLNQLHPKARLALEMRFGLNGEEPHTLEETGNKMGISRERVRQWESRGLSGLRHPTSVKRLKPFNEDERWG